MSMDAVPYIESANTVKCSARFCASRVCDKNKGEVCAGIFPSWRRRGWSISENVLKDHPLLRGYRWPSAAFFDGAAGPKNPRMGQQIFPGYPAGTEAVPNTWATWITGSYNLLCRRHSAIPITVMSYLRIRNGTFVC